MDKTLDIVEAKKMLDEAREHYDTAHRKQEEASRNETSARNRLNDAQKAFDAAVADVKKNPPWNSDWHQEHQEARRKA